MAAAAASPSLARMFSRLPLMANYTDEFAIPSIASPSASTLFTSVLVVIASLLVLEQTVYRLKKKHLPGDPFTKPIIGRFSDSLNPTLTNYQKSWTTPLRAISVFNIFIVMASSNEYARKILNSPVHAEPCLVASAKKVLDPKNWVFMNGKAHADYRKGLNVLFTKRALSIYLAIQQRIYRKHFAQWLSDADPKPKPFQMAFRDLNMETSLQVFCGSYISDKAAKEISDKYWLITQALELVNFPFAFPGTKVYNAIQARKIAIKSLEHASAESKKRMAAGGEPDCLVDAWIKEMIDARRHERDGDGTAEDVAKRVLIREYSDNEIAMVVLSFIFASQDAMTSSLTYLFQHLADHPDILAKLREEQRVLRGDDAGSSITLDIVDKMTYTRAVVKETLRLKPPVIMVPYKTLKPFPISDDYTVPTGTMVIPSFWNSLHDSSVFPNPDAFEPERWLEGGNAIDSPAKNWLVFGSGPHRCIGQEYANMHMCAVISSASMLMDWEHEVTPESEEVQIIATLFPKDGCRLKFRPRAQ